MRLHPRANPIQRSQRCASSFRALLPEMEIHTGMIEEREREREGGVEFYRITTRSSIIIVKQKIV